MEQIMVAIQDMASRMREGNLAFERSFARLSVLFFLSLSFFFFEEQVFRLVDDIGIEPRLQTPAYLSLVRNQIC